MSAPEILAPVHRRAAAEMARDQLATLPAFSGWDDPDDLSPHAEVDLLIFQFLGGDVHGISALDISQMQFTSSVDAVGKLIAHSFPDFGYGFLPKFFVDKKYGGVIVHEPNAAIELLKATIAGGDSPAISLCAALTARWLKIHDEHGERIPS